MCVLPKVYSISLLLMIISFWQVVLSGVLCADFVFNCSEYHYLFIYMGVLKMLNINVRSLTAHFDDFSDTVYTSNFDIICITETWLQDTVLSSAVQLRNYNLYRKDRGTRGGGVAIYVKNAFRSALINSINAGEAEQLWVRVLVRNKVLVFGVLYRPPTFSVPNFGNVLEESLAEAYLVRDEVVCCGDFNVDLLQLSSPASKCLQRVTESFDLTQIVDAPTRVTATSSTLIDLFFVSSTVNVAKCDVLTSQIFTDHGLVVVDLSCERSNL